MKYNTFIMLGKPGSGKGEQSKLLSKVTGLDVASLGGRFREIAAHNTTIGHKVKEVIDNGLLMPYWFASYLFLDTVINLENKEGVIFDGTARKKPEAELFHDAMTWFERPYMAIYINVSDEVVIERIMKRKETEGRCDDDTEAVRVRLKEYYDEAEPAIEYFRSTENFMEVQGDRTIEEIAKDIQHRLGLQ